MVPGIAFIATRRPLPVLRWAAVALVVVVLARVAWDPRIVGDDVGSTPILNWLLYGYGIPALSFWVAGHLLRKHADDMPARMTDSAAILFTMLLFFFEIRHLVYGGNIYHPGPAWRNLRCRFRPHWRQRSGSNARMRARAVSCTTLARDHRRSGVRRHRAGARREG